MWSNKLALAVTLLANAAYAQQPPLTFPASVQIETGDTWAHDGKRYRLYGVQACLRGTPIVYEDGSESDCGLVSIAPLAALFATGTIACQPIGTAKDAALFVVCGASIDGQNVDLGTALISTGQAFAAAYPDGNPVNTAYLVAEMTARAKRDGLWAGKFSHPVELLLKQF